MQQEQFDQIVLAYLERAENNGAPQCVRVSAERGCWLVPSSKEDGTFYEVRAKTPRPASDRPKTGRVGKWYHVLTCNCPAEAAGYQLCWHKAAVMVWFTWRREQADYLREDKPMFMSDALTDEVEAQTAEATIPAEVSSAGSPNPAKRRRGTTGRAANRSGGVVRLRRP